MANSNFLMESQGRDCHSLTQTQGHVLTTTCWKEKTNSTCGVYIVQYISNLEFGKYIKDIK